MNNRTVKILTVIFMAATLFACGGSGNDSGNLDNFDANLTGQPLSTELKAYKGATEIIWDILDQVSAGNPVVVPDTDSKAVKSGLCDATADVYTCIVHGDGGTCNVTVEPAESGDTIILGLECDDFSYTDYEGDNYLVDGSYDVSSLYEDLTDSLRITQIYTAPEAFSVTVNGSEFSYGGNFKMIVVTVVKDASITVTFDISDFVNGNIINAAYTLNCAENKSGNVKCLQAF